MTGSKIVYVLGDETSDIYPPLRDLIQHTKDNYLLANFFDSVSHAIQEEIDRVWRPQEPKPSFTCLLDLVDGAHQNRFSHPAVASSLLCTGQLAQFIRYFATHPAEKYDMSNSCMIGNCTGALAAAAIACTCSVLDLIPVAIHTIRIAFRLGAQAHTTAYDLHPSPDCLEPWSVAVSGVSQSQAKIIVTNFNEQIGLSHSGQLYLSAISSNTVTISGPPPILRRLVNTPEIFSGDSYQWLPVYAPYHASHLYGSLDMPMILDLENASARELLTAHRRQATMVSAVDGKALETSDLRHMLEQVISDILLSPLRWDKVLAGCIGEIGKDNPSECLVRPIGVSKATNSLVAALRARTQFKLSVDPSFSQFQSNVSEPQSEAHSNSDCPPIAIVGMAGKFPGANSAEGLWKVLEQGLDMHQKIPSDRFDEIVHVDADGKARNTSHTPYGCFIDDPGFFDARFFNMSPREALQTDPMQRLALSTTYHALEMSGFVPNRTPSSSLDRVGTFFGQTSDDYREINAAQDVDTYFITGGIRAFGPGRINYHFKFSGPSYNVDTACSSGSAAIQLACMAIWRGECDTAIAGGLSILTSPDLYAGLSRGQFLSKTGSCKTFDDGADGYCRADAVATIVLKKLVDAEADKDNILGVIRGAATNHSAEAISITHPHAETQSRLYRKVLQQAGIAPLDVNYIEMHGTGTQAGDATEMKSVSSVFAPSVGGRDPGNPLYVGAIKANVGHGEAASGVTALVKSLLMLRMDSIPPHVGIKTSINRTFPNLKERNICIAMKSTPFRSVGGRKRRIMVNNFSAAGGNTALLLEDGPSQPKNNCKDVRPLHIVTISAKTLPSLRKNTEVLLQYIREEPQVSLPSLSYTTTARRIHHPLRVTATGSNFDEISQELTSGLDAERTISVSSKLRVGFAFTGQGSHYPELAKQLFLDSRFFREEITRFDRIAKDQGYLSFLPLVIGDSKVAGTLTPVQVQLGLVCVEICLARLWASWGIQPDIVVGHSLGEYAALNIAGVLSSVDTVHMVGQRASLLETRCNSGSHAMLAVRGQANAIGEILKESSSQCEVACVNGPEDLVIAGPSEKIETLAAFLVSTGFRTTKLNVPFAFHSAQVDPILNDFEAVVNSVTLNAPRIPIISPLLGNVVRDHNTFTSEYFRRHAREPVNFFGALSTCSSNTQLDTDFTWIEIGPHPVCLGMMKATFGTNFSGLPSLRRNEDPWRTLTSALASLHQQGLPINWTAFHGEFSDAHHLLELPSFSFDESNYWIKYRNNWALTKGDHPRKPAQGEGPQAPLTTSVHRVLHQKIEGTKVSMTFESDFSDPLLHAVVMGHLVNGSGLCPSSLFADMALTIGDHVTKRLGLSADKLWGGIYNMEVSQPLIVGPMAPPPGHQLLHIKVGGDVSEKQLNVEFETTSSDAKGTKHHAKCIIRFGDPESWMREWARSAYLIKSRIDGLVSTESKGSVSRISQGLAYKLFTSLVDYGPVFRGMKEVFLDSRNFEATAYIDLEPGVDAGTFFMSPFWIDSLAHLSGFIMNATEATDSKQSVFISHGWETMRFAQDLSPGKRYTVYVKMQPVDSKTVAGDVFVLEGGAIVGLIGGLKFQQIPKALLDMLLPPVKASKIPLPAPTSSGPTMSAQKSPLKSAPQIPAPAAKPNEDILGVIAEEIGVAIQELYSAQSFAQLGVDSLLTLAILGKVQSTLGVTLPVTIFHECTTVMELQRYLGGQESSKAKEDLESDETLSSDEETSPWVTRHPTREISTAATSEAGGDPNALRSTIARETGIPVEDIMPSTRLDSMGLDSIMALSVIAALQAEGVNISRTAFFESKTIADLERSIGFVLEPNTSALLHSHTDSTLQFRTSGMPDTSAPPPRASSIILQGNPKTSDRTIFLFPDGSNSALAYSKFPSILQSVAIVGLNSPYITNPERYTCGLEALVSMYISEIRKIQRSGPFILGGWSVGGILAFEAAHQLIVDGQHVERLILIDAPCPLTISPMPSSLIDFFDSIGIFKSGSPQDANSIEKSISDNVSTPAKSRLLAHFASSVANLHNYQPKPLISNAENWLVVNVFWALEGVCDAPGTPRPALPADDLETASFMLRDRKNVRGGWGWEELLPGHHIKISQVGGNHFSLMREPWIEKLAEKIREAL
ncbi:hypothetical protein MMC30_004368 [Trapelia coarctata]|nr:hypothetical protein [Trapelia coarctata]